MKHTWLLFAGLVIAGAGGVYSTAYSQTADANANTNSAAQAGAIAGVGSIQIGNAARNTRQDVDYGGTYAVRDVPGVIAPALAAGVNSCAVSASVGGSVLGTGLTGGAAWSDKSCERRAEAAALAGLGYPDLALRHLAKDPEVFQTLVEAGTINGVAGIAPAELNDRGRREDRARTSSVIGAGGTRAGNTVAANAVCQVKPGTARTVVTNWPNKIDCARQLGLAK